MILTATQLHDLICKAKKKATQTGKRGGRYYISSSGKKVYTGEPAAPVQEKKSPALKHFLSTPHTSTDTQSPVQAQVEVTVLEPRQRVVPAELRFRPKAKQTPSSRVHVKIAQKRWRAYFCRSCRAAIIPQFADQTRWNKVRDVYPVEEKGEVKHWIVETEEEGSLEQYKFPNGAQARQFASDIREHFRDEGPWQRKDQIIQIAKTTLEGGHKHTEILEPGEPPPEAIAARVCDDCYRHNEVLSREVTGRTVIASTPASRKTARERKKLERQQERKLQAALKKDPQKRTPEQQQLVSQHEATELMRKRTAEEQAKEEAKTEKRKQYEEAMFEREEKAALEKIRHLYQQYLVKEKGMTPAKAAKEAAKLTPQEARDFQMQRLREHSERRAEKIKQLEKEHAGKRAEAFFDAGDLQAHMERRRQGMKGGEEHGAYRETLHPAEAAAAERARTARLRERQEQAKKKGKKRTRKSLWLSL